MDRARRLFNKLAPPPAKADDGRDQWSSRFSFILASCSGVVGMGNLLRYPWTVYNNSGLQFFILYLLAVFLLAIPALALEVTAGNAFRGGIVTAYNKISRRIRGIGFSLNYIGLVVTIYFVPIISWGIVYFQKSITSPLPWAGNTENYFIYEVVSAVNPEEEGAWVVYPGVALDGRLVGWNAFTFFIVWLCIFRGVGLTGRVVYFSLGLPIAIGVVLIGRGVSLPNATDRIRMYFASWNGERLSETRIWQDAVGQVFYSTGVGFGFYTAYASYNREAANSCQDAVIIACVNATFEVILTFVVFGIVGFLGITPESTGVIGSYSIGFMTYPEAFVRMPASNFFHSPFAILDAIITLIMDSPFTKRWGRPWVATALNVVCFLLSLPNYTQFGYWYLDGCIVTTTAYRYKDVVGQVGLPSFALYNAGYLGGQLIGIITRHTAGRIAGLGEKAGDDANEGMRQEEALVAESSGSRA
ncbi:hypothetical protein B0T11DRAFT_303870 [Plectosphaerella cucumerina]|uniref:Uncharacterized protein n=1 Tax=Plectosphaerella cucumerina TaxID=40658 RepID=A0A8K0X9Z5_9PEZI|nr:hypothetical protein B0T11DRAFT_303870 [Plectosphaerella cucumerina]